MAEDAIIIGQSEKPEQLLLRLANRHGLVTGATGTGKTVTLQVLAEGFSNAGVPVFAADVKGDLSGLAMMGDAREAFVKRAKDMGIDYQPDEFPVTFWDLFGQQGHPVRATVLEMGPLLMSRMLELNDTQEGVLNIAFRIADEQHLPLIDIKDLRLLLNEMTKDDGLKPVATQYGNVADATVGSILRQLLVLENQGATTFFGEPALQITDFMRTDRDGRGVVNILAADKLMANPRLYATFLLWMLSELFEQLPEVGDVDKPKLVFFFDEAHLLFNNAPKALLEAVEQVVRLIRSKGVGIYFVTQNPLDVPDTVLAQLGNRVQHALRAFTPRDQRAVKAAASTFRQNPKLNTEEAITQLGVGEALVSMLEGKGIPEMVSRTLIRPPAGRVGPVTPQERQAIVAASPLKGKYETAVDGESAYEILTQRRGLQKPATAPGQAPSQVPAGQAPQQASASGGLGGILGGILGGMGGGSGGGGRARMTVTERVITNMASSAARTVGTQVGRAILRGVLGSLMK
ncbi:helicase HerA-like domain-containing protein [Alsobacter sp. KACC 23698]|uniref:Helicase HerA-like domain-containing protein n=1 Tax=Alsobacter sp. KACC 23698 TaxID=3149229 RepID=A0AAU7JHT7_9HYPH